MRRKHANPTQVAVLLRVVEAVADHELVRDFEAYVLDVHVDFGGIR